MRGVRTLWQRARRQDGYSLVELLATLSILALVMGGLTQVFTAGLRAETEIAVRHNAQAEARGALSYLRREVHCANALTVVSSASIRLTLPAGCPTGSGDVSWCTIGSGSRWVLYRKPGATCDSTGKQMADFITAQAVFAYAVTPGQLAKLRVDFPVDVDTRDSKAAYRLQDDLVLRNTVRS
ncbi:MAG: PilW family protein [Gaiellaceae bacterium]